MNIFFDKMFLFLNLVLLFLASPSLTAQSMVEALAREATALKSLNSVVEARGKVDFLRQSLSVRPCSRKASVAERQAIIQTIVTAETASLLVDGAYNFQFSKTTYQLPTSLLSDLEKVHYGFIFGIARSTHLLALNPLFTDEDVATILGRDVLSRHMPEWMKETFSTQLNHILWEGLVRPYLKIPDFALMAVRQKERKDSQKNCRTFQLTVKPEDLEKSSECHTKRGLTFEPSAFLQPGNYTFDAFAINPDGACMFYGCQGPYGYFQRKDFGEQIIDNFDFDSVLQNYVKESILKDYNILTECLERDKARSILCEIGNCKVLIEELARLAFPLNRYDRKFWGDPEYEAVLSNFEKSCPLDKLKEVVIGETNSSSTRTDFIKGIITYPSIIAYLNSLNIYSFQQHEDSISDHNTLEFQPSSIHVVYKRSRKTFMFSGNGPRHVSRLVLRDESLESLFEYIKAVEHEKKYNVKFDKRYETIWMNRRRVPSS